MIHESCVQSMLMLFHSFTLAVRSRMDQPKALRSIFNKLNSENLRESTDKIAQIHAQLSTEKFCALFTTCLFENLKDIGLFYTEIVLNFASLATLVMHLEGCSDILPTLFSPTGCDVKADIRSRLVFFLSCLYSLDEGEMITTSMFIDFFKMHADDELPLLVYSFLKNCSTKLLALKQADLQLFLSDIRALSPASNGRSFRWNFLFETVDNLKSTKFKFGPERLELSKAKKSIKHIQQSLHLTTTAMDNERQADRKLHDLAKRLKFNSPSRFLIFSCLINHRHDMYRIVLDLSKLAEAMNSSFLKEISTVLFRCCIHEKSYNAFYQQVALRIDAELDHKMHRFFHSTCSNFLTNISRHTARSVSNAAKYFSALVLARQLDIQKVLADSPAESKRQKLFFQIIDITVSKSPNK